MRGAPAPPKRYTPPVPLSPLVKRRKLVHDEACFSCADGGELIECTVCPRVHHAGCVGLAAVPRGAWRCPWHECIECARKSTAVGGTLFHCMGCPIAYCFDCAPEEYTAGGAVRTPAAARMSVWLERRGVMSTKSYMFFHCAECKAEGRKPSARAFAA
jgi:hypothetical protein